MSVSSSAWRLATMLPAVQHTVRGTCATRRGESASIRLFAFAALMKGCCAGVLKLQAEANMAQLSCWGPNSCWWELRLRMERQRGFCNTAVNELLRRPAHL